MEAVCVRNAHKSYGSGRNAKKILDNLNMTVMQGTIYGLLGASGCGKTTLLSCILGRKKLDKGDVFVFGEDPTMKNANIAGNTIGYMPQEIALYNEFTIRETMIYFGWISGMTLKEIDEKLASLTQLLQLPKGNRFVNTLSGGQQRRVSFAVALLHDPQLFILDEPTVGVDLILRQNIWEHLLMIATTQNKTIIITTHYIEEARQAHQIGLMRNGELLAEKSPADLLATYQCERLEDVFLLLSQEQEEKGEGDGGATGGMRLTRIKNEVPQPRTGPKSSTAVHLEAKRGSGHMRMGALLHKNFLRLWRSLPMMLFIFGLPVMQVVIFCLAIGATPTDLKLAIIDEEIDVEVEECSFLDGCHKQRLSCRFVQCLSDHTFRTQFYRTVDEGMEAVREGNAWAMVHFSNNFSDIYARRSISSGLVMDENLEYSDIKVYPDMSNYQIFMTLQQDLTVFYNEFSRKLLEQCNQNPRHAESPLAFQDPIYGHRRASFTDFMAPGIILTSIFFLAVGLTSVTLIHERAEGLLDRSSIGGVTSFEILASHIITQFAIMCGQTLLVLVSMLVFFGVECKGSVVWVGALSILEGLCGMCFGFVISAMCKSETDAIQLTLGSFYPNLYLSGVVWPTEGMHWIMRKIAIFLPLTKATTGLRALMSRGWTIENQDIQIGFVFTIVWIVIFILISVSLMKIKTN